MTGDDRTATARCWALVGLRRYDEAAAAARAALATEPDDPDLLEVLVTALVDGDHPMAAVGPARRLLVVRPDDARPHQLLGWSLHRSKQFGDALPHLRRAVALAPTSVQAHVMLGDCLVAAASRQRHRATALALRWEAEQHGDAAIRLDPSRATGYFARASAALLWNPSEAEAWAQRGLEREPGNPVGHHLLGIVARSRGDVRTASDHFITAGRIDPRGKRALDDLRSLKSVFPGSAPDRSDRAHDALADRSSSTSSDLRTLLVLLVVVLVVAVLIGRVAASSKGPVVGLIALAAAVVGAVGLVWWWSTTARLNPRNQLSDEAKRVLEQDRAARRRR